MKKDELRILQVGNVLVSPDIITEKFCCDLDACKGECCIEGDAGAPVTLDEIMEIEDALDGVWQQLGKQIAIVHSLGDMPIRYDKGHPLSAGDLVKVQCQVTV